MNDIAIEEIRKTRKSISAEFGHDVHALLDHYKSLESEYKGRMIDKEQILTPADSISRKYTLTLHDICYHLIRN